MSIHPGQAHVKDDTSAEPTSQPPTKGEASTPAMQGVIKNEWDAILRRDASALKHMGVGALSALLIFTVAMGVYAAVAGAPASSARSSSPSNSSASSAAHVAQVAIPKYQPYNAQPPAASSASSVNITLTAEEGMLSIAPNVAYRAWTFNGTIPGPIVRVRQGQTVNFTLFNKGTMGHSIDFHAAQVPPNIDYRPIPPGGKISFSFTPQYPGVFMYHCGASPVMDHIANGMYGAIIVDPANGWSPAQEYVLVQSEFYTQKNADGSYSLDEKKMMSGMPDYVVFNGYSAQYVSNPLTAKPGQKIRLFVVNAGPTGFSAFHVIGAIFSDYYPDGNPANRLVGNQTVTIPPGGGAMVELNIPEAGKYPFVTHSFAAAMSGAIGAIEVR
jgi:nitrite reductase (NO-forming)